MAVSKNTAPKKKAPAKKAAPKRPAPRKSTSGSSGTKRQLRTASNSNSSSGSSALKSTSNSKSKNDGFSRTSESKGSNSGNENGNSVADRFKNGFGDVGESKESSTKETGKAENTSNTQEPKKNDPTAGLANGFQSDMQSFAKENPSGLNDVLQQAFPGATPEMLGELQEQAANGELNLPENVSFAGADQLNGANAAYSPDDNGTVLLAESLKNDPEALRKAYSEEVGHHFDQQLNGGKDSQGDEGQIFQEGLDNRGAISQERLQTLRAENDKNTAEINGVQKQVENSRPGDAKPADPGFQFDGVPHIDHTESIGWKPGSNKMSPTEANNSITENYGKMNEAMQRYLAGDPNGPKLPPISDWTSFGKYASREAGEQIRNLEDVARAADGDPNAARRVVQNMTGEESVPQAVGLGLGHAQDIAENADNPIQAAKEMGEAIGTPNTMLEALTRGNNGIYDNFAPAYDAFLRGEADGGKGLEALKKAGYGPQGVDENGKPTYGPQDRQGFLYNSLERYKQARELGLEAQQEKDPAKRQELLDKRTALVSQANLDLGNQEQMEVIQRGDIFGKREVSENIRAIGGTMKMHDANGTHNLLPNGGDWSDFPTRMGYKEVPAGTPGAQQIKDLNGKVHNYQVDPNAKGTISDYFNQNTTGQRAANLNNGEPRPLYGPDLSDSDLAGRVTAAAPRAASDVTERFSDNLGDRSSRLQQQGQALDNAGQMIGGPEGFMVRAVGQAENLVGKGGEVISDAGHTAANALNTAGDVAEVVVPQAINTTANAARTTARNTEQVGQGFQILGDAKIRAGQRQGGVQGTLLQMEGQLEKATGETLESSVQTARATYHATRRAAPVVYRNTVRTVNNTVQAANTTARAVKRNLSNRVAPWNPRAVYPFGIPNPFR